MSPIHAFFITVGELDDLESNSDKYTSSATTIKFSAYNYTVLDRLAEPLCHAANDFVKSLRIFLQNLFARILLRLFWNIAFSKILDKINEWLSLE